MKKKFYIIALFIISILVLSFSYTFAANEPKAVQDIRNVVGGAENIVEDAGRGIVDGVRNVTAGGENIMENATRDAQNGVQDAGNRVAGAMTDDNYDATRTTTRSADINNGEGTFLGINSTTLTWLIIAVVAIAIIALIWMYARQNNNSYNDD